MRNSTIVISFFGIVVVAAIIFAVVILPKMDFGSNNIDIEIELPVSKSDLRYIEKGITPFCKDNNSGIQMEVRDGCPVTSSINGIVYKIENNSIYIRGEEVYVVVSPIRSPNVIEGDYISVGDVLGYVDGNMLSIKLDNYKDSRYECPYLYMSDISKKILTDGLLQNVEETNKICECSYISY